MQVNIIRITHDPINAIASAFAITRGLTYVEYLEQYPTEQKRKALIMDCYNSGHMSGFEFVDLDVEVLGFSRVFETDKVRSRIASYEIEAGRYTESRGFESVIPTGYDDKTAQERIAIIKQWNDEDKQNGIDPRNRRYWTNQGVARRGRVKKNLRSWIETSRLRMCSNTQWEYRKFMDLVYYALNQEEPFFAELFGAKCIHLGYCPEVFTSCQKYPSKQVVLEAYQNQIHAR